nr:MAG TPA: hypothetical protein [Caudoviricetes sp.]
MLGQSPIPMRKTASSSKSSFPGIAFLRPRPIPISPSLSR